MYVQINVISERKKSNDLDFISETFSMQKKTSFVEHFVKKKLFLRNAEISLPTTQGQLRVLQEPKVSLKNVVRLITGQGTGRQLLGANPIKEILS